MLKTRKFLMIFFSLFLQQFEKNFQHTDEEQNKYLNWDQNFNDGALVG